MKLTVQNFGAISKAEINLDKPLILFTGENNSGKTYLAYLVYSIFKPGKPEYGFFGYKDEERTSGKNSWFLDLVSILTTFIEHKVNHGLTDFFSIEKGVFQKPILQVSFEEGDEIIEKFKKAGIANSIHSSEDRKIGAIYKGANKLEILMENSAQSEQEWVQVYWHFGEILESFFIENLPTTIIIPAERKGINLFQKELSIIKNRVFDAALGNWKSRDLIDFFATRFNKYPKPIKDALETAQNLDSIQKQHSEFAWLADELEKSFLDGKISLNDQGDIQFKPKGASGPLEIHMASSSVKSLATLGIYLRHQAKKGDVIIIDEPESNLHPNNQLKIARFLARLVNEGFRVLVSTHSDYIVRELNNLIMLGSGLKSDEKSAQKLMKTHGYAANELLTKDQLGVYLFQAGKEVAEVPVSETGFEVKTIDDTIERLNRSSQDIYSTLFD